MISRYKLFLRVIVVIMFLSILKVNEWVEKHTSSYAMIVGQSFVFRITRLNWQYGFFTSKRNDYQFIKSDIALVDDLDSARSVVVARSGGLDTLVHGINAVRVNTAIQQIVRDSLYLEAGSRAMSLYLFQQHPDFRNINFSIQAYNKKIRLDGNRYRLVSKTDTLFNRRISY
ncbi:hypothetical protein ACS5PU_16580 [Pedobacter sp. GSP4]|uniref:hypothetical protein n=1 Tax=Pedobacter sp. GSP4 TaxID=3453716 RepID=UPI003EF07C03